jgi:hypothetical protein
MTNQSKTINQSINTRTHNYYVAQRGEYKFKNSSQRSHNLHRYRFSNTFKGMFFFNCIYLLFLFSGVYVCMYVCIVYSHLFYAYCVLFLSMVDGSVCLVDFIKAAP